MKTCSFFTIRTGFAAAAIGIAISGCATQRPVLYPNAKLNQAGQEAAQRDIDDCVRLASQSGASNEASGQVARKSAEGAVVGGVAGAAVGAVRGDVWQTAAEGAAGAAAGVAAYALLHSNEPSPIFKEFVQRCLRERGYEVIGWQ